MWHFGIDMNLAIPTYEESVLYYFLQKHPQELIKVHCCKTYDDFYRFYMVLFMLGFMH